MFHRYIVYADALSQRVPHPCYPMHPCFMCAGPCCFPPLGPVFVHQSNISETIKPIIKSAVITAVSQWDSSDHNRAHSLIISSLQADQKTSLKSTFNGLRSSAYNRRSLMCYGLPEINDYFERLCHTSSRAHVDLFFLFNTAAKI